MSLLGHLNTLESAGLVRLAQLEPDLEYLFRHALVREAAYTSLLTSDQKKLHLAVGEAIELLYPDRLDEYAAMLSYHFGEAGDTRKASRYCTLAGKAALKSFANQEAENQFRCALALENNDPDRADLLYLLGESLYLQSRYKEAVQTWHEGLQLYQQLGDDEGVARLYARSARAAWHGGDQPEGLRLSQQGLQDVGGMDDSPAKAMLVHEAARAYHFNGFPGEAEQLCRQALEMAEQLNAIDILADASTTLGVLPNVPIDEATRSLERAVELAESNGLLEIASRAHHNLGYIHGYRGDQTTARVHYLRAAEIARTRGAAQQELFSLASAASESIGLGDIQTGKEIFSQIKQLQKTLSNPNQVQLEINGIEIGLEYLMGEFQQALDVARAARSEARQRGDLQMLYNFCTSIADVHLVMDRVETTDSWSEAEQAVEEAIEISRRGVSDPIRPLRQLSTIKIRQGELDKASQLFIEAKTRGGSSPHYWQQHSLLENQRDLAAAQAHWTEALTTAETVSKRLAQAEMRLPWAFSLFVWADIHLARGEPADYERAWAIYGEALALFEEMGADFYAGFVEEQLKALRTKSYAVSLAHEEVTQELAQAGKVQESFLPEAIPEISGWDISAILRPARETSGDFYDFIHLPGDRLGFVVADVADKGMGAALYMATCRTLIRTYAGEFPGDPAQVLTNANRRILADTHSGLFITVFYGVLNPRNGELTYCNAGHNPPFVFSPDPEGDPQILSRSGMPLGIMEQANWEQDSLTIEPGHVLVAFTDGVTEAQNDSDEFYGEGRLISVGQSAVGLSAKEIQEVLEQDLKDFAGQVPRLDDMTYLVLKRH